MDLKLDLTIGKFTCVVIPLILTQIIQIPWESESKLRSQLRGKRKKLLNPPLLTNQNPSNNRYQNNINFLCDYRTSKVYVTLTVNVLCIWLVRSSCNLTARNLVTFDGNGKNTSRNMIYWLMALTMFKCVAFIEGLKHNLLCISQLCDKESYVNFNDRKCTI